MNDTPVWHPAPKGTLVELFAGTGMLGEAVQDVLDVQLSHVAEFDPAPSAVLHRAYPDVPNLRDVTTVPWAELPRPTAFSGGSPCQDVSGCGRRAGMVPGTRSGLWESMREGIATLRPPFVAWENVRAVVTSRASSALDPTGKLGHLRALGRVLGDLSTLGYDAEWVGVRAADVGAPHGRFRVFLFAWDRYAVPAVHPGAEPFAQWDELGDTFTDLYARRRAEGRVYGKPLPTDGAMRDGRLYLRAPLPALYPAVPVLRTPMAQEAGGGPLSPAKASARGQTLRLTGLLWDLFHPGVLDGVEDDRTPGWREYQPAIDRWEGIMGRPAPEPFVAPSRPGARLRPNPALGEWVMGMDEGHVTDPSLGLSLKDMWKLCGNGVVRQQAVYALRGCRSRMAGAGAAPVARVLEDAGALW